MEVEREEVPLLAEDTTLTTTYVPVAQSCLKSESPAPLPYHHRLLTLCFSLLGKREALQLSSISTTLPSDVRELRSALNFPIPKDAFSDPPSLRRLLYCQLYHRCRTAWCPQCLLQGWLAVVTLDSAFWHCSLTSHHRLARRGTLTPSFCLLHPPSHLKNRF